MSKISVEKPQCGNNLSWFRVLIGVFVVLVVLFVIFAPGPRPIPRERAYRIICHENLNYLCVAMQVYASNYDNKYPTSDKWCDLLLQRGGVREESFVCKGAFKKGNKEPCHYAINPNCEPNSLPDMVLLFETKGGWNQVGGSELLTFENHKGKGCNILFNDGHVEFVNTERIGELNWDVEKKQNDKSKFKNE